MMKRQYPGFIVQHNNTARPADVPSGGSFVMVPRRESMVMTHGGLVLTAPRTTSLVSPGLPGRVVGPVAKVWRWLSSPMRHPTWSPRSPPDSARGTGRSGTGRSLLSTQSSGKYRGINEHEASWMEEDYESQSDDDGALCKATIVFRRPHAFCVLLCLAAALTGMAVLLFCMGGFLSPASSEESSSAATDAAAAALMGSGHGSATTGSANSTAALRARRLTERYIQLRFLNNVDNLETLFHKDILMHVDLSKAGMLVGMKIKSTLGFKTELSGKAEVAKYYRAMPTEQGDRPPKTSSFRCIGNACVVTCSVQRPVVGGVTDVGTLHWDAKQDLLREVDLSFWAR